MLFPLTIEEMRKMPDSRTPDVLALIGCQKAEFDHASKLRTWTLRLQALIGLVAAGTIFVKSDTWLYIAAVFALALALLWLALWLELGASRGHAERLRRATLIVGGLGVALDGAEAFELANDGKAPKSEAKRLVDPEYFASKSHPGTNRLIEMLEESAIWTTNLAGIACRETWLMFGGFVALATVTLLSSAALIDQSGWELAARAVFAVLAVLLSADFLGAAASYGRAQRGTARIVDKLQRHKGQNPSVETIILILGDYNSNVESMPTFSSGLYPRHQRRLNEQYNMYLTGPQ
ncbi:MAG: hypothetical protein KF842_10505 [Caulobacter sp.]|nr:hypothetical protein [Caulobacter sp.]